MVVWRLEAKRSSVQGGQGAALAAALQVDVATIHQLLLDPAATTQDGQRAAGVALGQMTGPLDEASLLGELEMLVRVEPTFATLLRRTLRAWQLAQA